MNSTKFLLILFTFYLTVSISAAGCGKGEVSQKTGTVKKDSSDLNSGSQNANSSITDQTDFPPVTLDFKTATGKFYLVIIKKNSESLIDMMISGLGFENSNDTMIYKDSDPFDKALMGDLDGNGFDDFLVVTRSAGSGSYAGLYGVASNDDKSFTQINFPPVTEADMQPGKPFEGYMGHDFFNVEDNVLIREFPVYRSGDPNSSPTGGKRRIRYKLTQGETMYQLVVDKVEDLK